jgi:hypothetical protein
MLLVAWKVSPSLLKETSLTPLECPGHQRMTSVIAWLLGMSAVGTKRINSMGAFQVRYLPRADIGGFRAPPARYRVKMLPIAALS